MARVISLIIIIYSSRCILIFTLVLEIFISQLMHYINTKLSCFFNIQLSRFISHRVNRASSIMQANIPHYCALCSYAQQISFHTSMMMFAGLLHRKSRGNNRIKTSFEVSINPLFTPATNHNESSTILINSVVIPYTLLGVTGYSL